MPSANRGKKAAMGLAAARLDPAAATPLHRQIYQALRQDILHGHLKPGQRLAATRIMARELGVSRNTVLNAFDQLLAEGYLKGRQGAGTYITDELPEQFLERPRGVRTPGVPRTPLFSRRLSALRELPLLPGARGARPFLSGLPALDVFPHDLWRRLAARRLQRLRPDSFGYGDPAGYEPLREALAVYLRTSRGLDCEPGQVLVVAGSQQGLAPGRLLSSTRTSTRPESLLQLAAPPSRARPGRVESFRKRRREPGTRFSDERSLSSLQ